MNRRSVLISSCRPPLLQNRVLRLGLHHFVKNSAGVSVTGQPLFSGDPVGGEMNEFSAIIRPISLGVDFAQTVSCYQADADGRACRHCDACRLRAQGFAEAGVADPTRYVDGGIG